MSVDILRNLRSSCVKVLEARQLELGKHLETETLSSMERNTYLNELINACIQEAHILQLMDYAQRINWTGTEVKPVAPASTPSGAPVTEVRRKKRG